MQDILNISSQSEMTDFAHKVANICKAEDVILLKGTLGVGKTFFAQNFIKQLSTTNVEVTSPTFTLLQTYDSETVLEVAKYGERIQ